MTLIELAKSRVTPKFKSDENFNKVLEFLTTNLSDKQTDIDLIAKMRNIDIDNSYILDEIGKILGIKRPVLKIGVAVAGFFQYGINGYDLNPYSTGDSLDVRKATNEEYRKLLRAVAKLSLFRGTIDEVVSLYSELSDSSCYIVNKIGSYDIVFLTDLTNTQKALIEYLSSFVDILTIKRDFLGTSPDGQPFQYGVSGYGTSPYILAW